MLSLHALSVPRDFPVPETVDLTPVLIWTVILVLLVPVTIAGYCVHMAVVARRAKLTSSSPNETGAKEEGAAFDAAPEVSARDAITIRDRAKQEAETHHVERNPEIR